MICTLVTIVIPGCAKLRHNMYTCGAQWLGILTLIPYYSAQASQVPLPGNDRDDDGSDDGAPDPAEVVSDRRPQDDLIRYSFGILVFHVNIKIPCG